jgi:sigma-E factor negative regulatory protein RseA
MNKESLEHLSSLMDGEMSRETGLFMTRRLSSDDALCAAWKRYHLIRDCIRQPGGSHAMPDLSERVQSALAEEPVQTLATPRNRWFKPVSGLAIAASVALLAVVMVQPDAGLDNGLEASPAVDAEPFTSPNTINAVTRSQPASYSPRLNSYLLRHKQLARSTGQQGFVSFVPMISTQAVAADESLDQAITTEAEATKDTAVDQRQ